MVRVERYAERDIEELDNAGSYYIRHVGGMTAEQLHSKSAIAAELGWRDMQIDALQQKLDAMYEKGMELLREASNVYRKYNETQMPDRDLVDEQTLQEFSDLVAQLRNGEHVGEEGV